MLTSPHKLDLPDADSTARFGVAMAQGLAPGDCVLLSGSVGAGKTHFARALIQSILPLPEDVPSPTFTLVQTYDTHRGSLWHVDLYRISMDTEIDELGLFDAFDSAICLVEWPDRLGALAPQNALSIALDTVDEGRRATLSWSDDKWATHLHEATQNV